MVTTESGFLSVVEAFASRPFELRRIRLADIVRTPELQARVALQEEVVDRYAELYRSAVAMPPLDAFEIDSLIVLAEGNHRWAGAQRAGLTEIEVRIYQGTHRDALLFAMGANAGHGLALSNEDKRRAVSVMLADPEWQRWSDRRLATFTGGGARFVAKMRKELGTPPSPTRIGRDGRATSTTSIGRRTPAPSTGATAEPDVDSSDLTAHGAQSDPPTPPAVVSAVSPQAAATPQGPAAVPSPPAAQGSHYFFNEPVPWAAWLFREGQVVGISIGVEGVSRIDLDAEEVNPDEVNPDKEHGGDEEVRDEEVRDEEVRPVVTSIVRITNVVDRSLLPALPKGTQDLGVEATDVRVLPASFADSFEFVLGTSHARALLSAPLKSVAAYLSDIGKVVPYSAITAQNKSRVRAGRQLVLAYGHPLSGGAADVEFLAVGHYDADGKAPEASVWMFGHPNKALFVEAATIRNAELLYGILVDDTAVGPTWSTDTDANDMPADFLRRLGLKTEEEDEEHDEEHDA